MRNILRWLYDVSWRFRRVERLARIVLPYLPEEGNVLDLGCGRGDLTMALKAARPQVSFTGLDVLPHPVRAGVALAVYDGEHVPYGDASFDWVMLITVLHHTDDYRLLLAEARRVARKGIIILDHQYTNWIDWLTLAFIDWPGNVPFGVHTPFNFSTRGQWLALFGELGLKESRHEDGVAHFGPALAPLLGRNLHFVSVVEPEWTRPNKQYGGANTQPLGDGQLQSR